MMAFELQVGTMLVVEVGVDVYERGPANQHMSSAGPHGRRSGFSDEPVMSMNLPCSFRGSPSSGVLCCSTVFGRSSVWSLPVAAETATGASSVMAARDNHMMSNSQHRW